MAQHIVERLNSVPLRPAVVNWRTLPSCTMCNRCTIFIIFIALSLLQAQNGFPKLSQNPIEGTMQPVQLVQILLLSLFGLNAYASEPIVHTQSGDVRGVSQGHAESFKALPYAASPVGNLRWMPPQEPTNWMGIRDASNFSPKCPQKRPDDVIVGNEDCLYLNVFRPAGATETLPVIVFIHGGSNFSGSASLTSPNVVAVYDGSRLAQNENVVVVTLNYRLGPLGFLVHSQLSATSGYMGSGNYAYMDQIQALKWVQRNIAAFSGDPSNVTLFGHSAGA